MRLKIFSITFLIILFILFLIFLYPDQKEYVIREIISPCEMVFDNGERFKMKEFECFEPRYSEENKFLASQLNLSEDEAFIIGNLGKYWAANILTNKKVNIYGDKIVFYPYSYHTRFINSPYCIKNGEFLNPKSASKLIEKVRNTKYKIYDLDNDEYYPFSRDLIPENYVLLGKKYKKKSNIKVETPYPSFIESNDIKLVISDFTNRLKPNDKCSTEICKEILYNINSSKSSIDIAIYGYSKIPEIEHAIKNAQKRGVKIRLVYDLNKKGESIYEHTSELANLIKNSKNDKNSLYSNSIMHNKFFIIDERILITGSANLSRSDMSGFNSNSIIVINSPEIAKIYKQEFEQMYLGKFHIEKQSLNKTENIYFSPQDKAIENGVIPIIKNAKRYIYMPIFVITDENCTSELIKAQKRGVDVKIIIDALNASSKYSRVKELRSNGVKVKIENYAGKLHSKTIIVDDEFLIIGSMNYSSGGENKNDENLMILENADLTKFYKGFFLYLWDKIPDKWLKFYPKAESFDSIGSCFDGIDNDYDGLIDAADDGCKARK